MAFSQLRRREFITLVGGATIAWPFVARGQQAERVRRIGILMGYTANDPAGLARLAALHEGLEELGWSEGRNLKIEARFAGADTARIAALSAERATERWS